LLGPTADLEESQVLSPPTSPWAVWEA